MVLALVGCQKTTWAQGSLLLRLGEPYQGYYSAGISYATPSKLRFGGGGFGEIDTWDARMGYVGSIGVSSNYAWQAGMRYAFSRHFGLSIEGGWLIEREWNFDEQDFVVRSDGAPFFGVSLNGTY